MNRNRPTASTREPKSNGGDRVIRTLRVYESGRVAPVPGRPPKDWAAVIARAAAHALPSDAPSAPAAEVPRVKNPAKVAAGKARAAQAKARREAEAAAAKKVKTAGEKVRSNRAAAKKAKAPLAAVANDLTKRGGARPNSGPKPAAGEAMVVTAMRVTKLQKEKLAKLGANWLRARIDSATLPGKK